MKSGTASCRRIFLAHQDIVVMFAFVSNAYSQSGSLITVSELPAAVAQARPGDVLLVRAGEYPDQVLSLSGAGELGKPIVVKAEKPGAVAFTAGSSLRIDGDWLTLDGFLFTDGFSPGKEVISLAGSHCSLINCVIDSYNPPDADKEDKWVTLRGKNHLVENCTFKNKTSKSVTLTVWRDGNDTDEHIIRKNHFFIRLKGAKSNGYETIRIGTSENANSDSMTTVSDNLFKKCDGEMEIISVKSGKNIIKGNTFDECAGTLTLRHGNGSTVERNLFVGRQKKETGGIRIYGADHLIGANAIIGTGGRAGGAIALMCGTPSPPANGFQAAKNVQIVANLIASNEGAALKFDTSQNEDGRTVLPSKILVKMNTLSGADPNTLLEGFEKLPPGGMVLDRNQIFQNNQIPVKFTEGIAPPLNASDVGAPWFRNKIQK